jgi:hypothetical protein
MFDLYSAGYMNACQTLGVKYAGLVDRAAEIVDPTPSTSPVDRIGRKLKDFATKSRPWDRSGKAENKGWGGNI